MNELIQLTFSKNTKEQDHHPSYLLFYLLSGAAVLKTDEKQYQMGTRDIIVLNPLQAYELLAPHGVYAKLIIDCRELIKITDYKSKYFECNTVKEHHEGFEKLTFLLDQLLNTLLETENKRLFFQQCAYQLVVFLITEFSHNICFDVVGNQRIQEIETYIFLHYQEDLTLESISRKFGLTPPYFSKFFKDQFHVSFLKYLNQLRLEHACFDLLHDDTTILRIALENGFPNLASFTRVFHQTYGVTPGQYRIAHKREENAHNEITEDIKGYLHASEPVQTEHIHPVRIDFDQEKKPLQTYWFQLCNLGDFSNILKDGMRAQIQQIQEELGFRYARVFLDQQEFEYGDGFYKEETVLDFLFETSFKLHLVIDFRRYEGQAEFLTYFKAFLSHFINRYGFKNVDTWCFELYYDCDFSDDKAEHYASFYRKIQSLLGEIELNCRLYGPGLLLDEEGHNLKQFLKKNKSISYITISVAPYSIRNKSGGIFINRTTDTNFLFEQYQLAKNICQTYAKDCCVSIVSWKDQLNDITVMNDAPYRAARIIQNVIKGYAVLPSLPIDKILDLQMNQHMSNRIFSGLPGIICRKGVKKPSFYAYKFLKKLDQYMLHADQTVLVTCSNKKYIQLICHNCKKLNYRYYSQEDGQYSDIDLNQYYENQEVLTISFRFEHMEQGTYVLKQRYVNDEDGNSFMKWKHMKFGKNSFYGVDELEYLKAAAQPAINGTTIQSIGGVLEFECTLQANEIKHLHLIYEH